MEQARWYSGKYDSVKQRKVIQNSLMDEKSTSLTYEQKIQRAYWRYSASLRLEMLLCGKVVITDAEWYDGAYFAHLSSQKEEWNNFLKFLDSEKKQKTFFEVKRRQNYVGMFGKPFTFSSILDNPNLENSFSFAVKRFGQYCESHEIKFTEIDGYLSALERYILSNCSNHLTKLGELSERLKRLETVPAPTFSGWKNMNALPETFDFVNGRLSARQQLLQSLENWAEGFGGEQKEGLEHNKKQLKQALSMNFPNRSVVLECVNSSEKLAGVEGEKTHFRRFMKAFDYNYNLGLARQHDCTCIDIVDRDEDILTDIENKKIDMKFMEWPDLILQGLGACSWEDFQEIIFGSAIYDLRNKWLSSYLSLSKAEKSGEKAERDFYNLCNEIVNRFEQIKRQVYKGASFYNGDSDSLLVGASCDLSICEANDFCVIYNPRSMERGILYRIHQGEDPQPDQTLDTIVSYGKDLIKSII